MKVFKTKAKSAHDIGDPSLLAKKLDDLKSDDSSDESSSGSEDNAEQRGEVSKKQVNIDAIKSKLKRSNESTTSKQKSDSKANQSSSKAEEKLSEAELKK